MDVIEYLKQLPASQLVKIALKLNEHSASFKGYKGSEVYLINRSNPDYVELKCRKNKNDPVNLSVVRFYKYGIISCHHVLDCDVEKHNGVFKKEKDFFEFKYNSNKLDNESVNVKNRVYRLSIYRLLPPDLAKQYDRDVIQARLKIENENFKKEKELHEERVAEISKGFQGQINRANEFYNNMDGYFQE